jgi:hypothetical protein
MPRSSGGSRFVRTGDGGAETRARAEADADIVAGLDPHAETTMIAASSQVNRAPLMHHRTRAASEL